MSELIKPEQIISGIKNALIFCEAITPENATALEALLNGSVLDDIIEYGKQANGQPDNHEQALPIRDVSQQHELLVLAFSWVSCIGEQFFDSSKTVEDMVDAFLAKNNCG